MLIVPQGTLETVNRRNGSHFTQGKGNILLSKGNILHSKGNILPKVRETLPGKVYRLPRVKYTVYPG